MASKAAIASEEQSRDHGLVRAMGWTRGAIREFMDLNDRALSPVVRASERVYAIAAAARTVRMILQVAAIGAGAWLRPCSMLPFFRHSFSFSSSCTPGTGSLR